MPLTKEFSGKLTVDLKNGKKWRFLGVIYVNISFDIYGTCIFIYIYIFIDVPVTWIIGNSATMDPNKEIIALRHADGWSDGLWELLATCDKFLDGRNPAPRGMYKTH